jgi:hypothetical protein
MRPITTELEDRIRRLIAYDPETGSLTWKEKPNRNIPIGQRIGSQNIWGHIRFAIMGRQLMVHRVAWFLYYGTWPQYQIDHIDGNPANNRIVNLRDVPQELNMQNKHKTCAVSGLMGAHSNKNNTQRPWSSNIKANGQYRYLGQFATALEAHLAYMKAKAELHDR